ncbi:MAG: hypothetical protein JW804_08490 [Sedimentisphaerales bacterium]|nr:hypothetical protein [Sedimentisphaerales bacterium]
MSRLNVFVLAICFLILPAADLFAAEPKVIETEPANGDTNVDPRLKMIRIVFDQDMDTVGGYSVCGGGPTYPKTIGNPRWSDKRTFVMRVRLEPEHKYILSINCQNYRNFVGENGESAIPYPVEFKTGPLSKEKRKEDERKNNEALEILKEAINEQYSYRDIRGVDWDKLFTEYDSKLKNARTTSEFAKLTAELLVNAKDKHIWVKADEENFPCYFKKISPNANLSKLPEYVKNFRKVNNIVCVGKCDDGVGYIYIDSWPGDQREMMEPVYEAIWELAKAPGIIIDVRGNGGGAEPLAQEVAGCFINERKLYAKHVNRAAGSTSGFSEVHERYLEPNKRRPRYRGKTAVLSGPVVMSSCEAFVLMMKQVPNCKIVGMATQGSSGNPKPIELGNGVTVYLPSWKDMRPDGSCFEGEGIEPDIEVKTSPEDFDTKDPVIEAALKYIRS